MGTRADNLEYSQMSGMADRLVEQEFEIFVGADKVVRINIDGICALRGRLVSGSRLVLHGALRHFNGIEDEG